MAEQAFRIDPDFLELVQEGRAMADAGDIESAEAIFKAALGAARGTNHANEVYALSSLMTIYQRARRHFESMVLARVVVNRLKAVGEIAKAAGCFATLVSTTWQLDDMEDLRAHLDELAELNAQFPVQDNTVSHEIVHWYGGMLAVRDGDLDGARAHLDAWRQIEPIGEARSWRKPMEECYLSAEIANASGNPDEAVRLFDRALALGITEPEMIASLRRRRAEAVGAAGDLDQARADLSELLDDLETKYDLPFRAPARIRQGTQIAAWLEANGGGVEDTHRAYDAAATAVIQRICQLDEALKELPELGVNAAEVGVDLPGYRKRFVAERSDLMRRVGEFLRSSEGGAAAEVLYGQRDDGYVRICAWCESVCPDGTSWLPIGHYVPRGDETIPITHSICPSCASEMGA